MQIGKQELPKHARTTSSTSRIFQSSDIQTSLLARICHLPEVLGPNFYAELGTTFYQSQLDSPKHNRQQLLGIALWSSLPLPSVQDAHSANLQGVINTGHKVKLWGVRPGWKAENAASRWLSYNLTRKYPFSGLWRLHRSCTYNIYIYIYIL